MTASELIRKLEELRAEHFRYMKQITPMGEVPDEPEVFIDEYAYNEDGELYWSGFTNKNFDVLLDLTKGITILQK